MEKKTYYLTKYSLTEGISTFEGVKMEGGCYVVTEIRQTFLSFKLGKDCFETKEEALKDMLLRIDKKVAASQRTIARLEKLRDSIRAE